MKNTADVLPLANSKGSVIAVVGPNAQSRKNLLGGWSVHWQGPTSDQELPGVFTVAEAIARGGLAHVANATGVLPDGSLAGDNAIAAAEAATTAVVCAPCTVSGEWHYSESWIPRTLLYHGRLLVVSSDSL